MLLNLWYKSLLCGVPINSCRGKLDAASSRQLCMPSQCCMVVTAQHQPITGLSDCTVSPAAASCILCSRDWLLTLLVHAPAAVMSPNVCAAALLIPSCPPCCVHCCLPARQRGLRGRGWVPCRCQQPCSRRPCRQSSSSSSRSGSSGVVGGSRLLQHKVCNWWHN